MKNALVLISSIAFATIAGAVKIDVVYPPAGSTLPEDGKQTYVIGSVSPANAPLFCNGKSVSVYRTGGFLFMHTIAKNGKCTLRFTSGKDTLDHSFIIKPATKKAGGIVPVSPKNYVAGLVGEPIALTCNAPAGREVHAMVGERDVTLAETKSGVYSGKVSFANTAEKVPVLFWSDGLPDAEAGTVGAKKQWPCYKVTGALFETRFRSLPNDGDSVAFPKPGFSFRSNGVDRENVRAEIGGRTVYILRSALAQVSSAPENPPMPDISAERPSRPSQGKPPKDICIVVDAGHGGSDPGALGPRRLNEKTANLQQAICVADALKKAGFKVIMTRHDDRFIGLYDRVRLGWSEKADCFISIHHNATAFSGNPQTARSSSTFYWNERGRALAACIQPHVANTAGIPDRGIQSKSLAVCRNPAVPSCLIEFDFINCPEGEEAIFDGARQKRFGEAVTAGVLDWLSGK